MPPKRLDRRCFAVGAALAALQVALAVSVAPGDGKGLSLESAKNAYFRLCSWDCGWYEGIAREGYHSTVPPVPQNGALANVAFFPAYPLLARLLYVGAGIDPKLGLLLIAQLSCILFWAALWALLRRQRVPTAMAWLVVLAILAHPASFFLVGGYSESLFLATLLIFVLYGSAGSRRDFGIAAAAGTVLSATRLIGVAAAAYPLARLFSGAWAGRRWPPPGRIAAAAALSIAAMSGALLFFAYCWIRFGRYDLYLETQRIGWGIVPDYGALWKWADFTFRFPFDRAATWASGLAFALVAELELALAFSSGARGLRRRLPVYATAFAIFFVTLCGLKSVGFLSMIRYTLPWHALLLLCLAQAAARLPRDSRALSPVAFAAAASALLILLYSTQLPHLREFLGGQWFA